MCDMDPDGPPSDPVKLIIDGIMGNASRARCRHACPCGCHDGRVKHVMSCTQCVTCTPRSGHRHYAVRADLLEAHLRECHLEL